MSMVDRLLSLKTKHADLENAIHAESIRPAPDEVALHELKKQKLRIKDEIANLEVLEPVA